MFEPTLTKVHEDERGAIYAIALEPGQELLLIHSKAGSWRGGHQHNCDEVTMLLSGKMTYHKAVLPGFQGNVKEGEWVEAPLVGLANLNKAGIVHMGEFHEDSWILDWRLGTPTAEIETTNYPPFRARVEAQQ